MRKLTADDFLHGAFYAAEQAGLLLHDAVHMWQRGRHSTAAALAVFAREEIGRYRVLLDARLETMKAEPYLTSEDVAKRCKNHVEKIRRAISGVFYEYDPNTDPELKGLSREKVDVIVRARMTVKAKNLPGDTLDTRFEALYVDVDENGTWNRPSRISAKAASDLIYETMNDYARILDCLSCPQQSGECMELAAAFAAWPGRPTLPPLDGLAGFSQRQVPAA
jgi:AbiV family abortive infection protein